MIVGWSQTTAQSQQIPEWSFIFYFALVRSQNENANFKSPQFRPYPPLVGVPQFTQSSSSAGEM